MYYSAVVCSAVQCNTVQCFAVQCSEVYYSSVLCIAVQFAPKMLADPLLTEHYAKAGLQVIGLQTELQYSNNSPISNVTVHTAQYGLQCTPLSTAHYCPQ